MKNTFHGYVGLMMKSLTVAACMLVIPLTQAQNSPGYLQLRSEMQEVCPIAWEDLSIAINASIPTGDVWQSDSADRAAFVARYASDNSVSNAAAETAADDLTIVSSECATYRLALLDSLMEKTPIDVSLALDAASGGSFNGSGWLTGDVRMTGRAIPAAGWVFMVGQSVGADGSAADLTGDDYQALFELAKTWAPNTGSEVWGSAVVTLPDMRGRSMFGADNMGGTSANVLADAAADQVGGTFGSESQVLSEDQLPTHTHTMNNAGNHSHTMGFAGQHGHNLRSSPYGGSGQPRNWDYFEGRARTNYRNNIAQAVRPAGNHNHSLSSNGNHQHTLNDAGNSAAVTTVSPGIVFNVEMKL